MREAHPDFADGTSSGTIPARDLIRDAQAIRASSADTAAADSGRSTGSGDIIAATIAESVRRGVGLGPARATATAGTGVSLGVSSFWAKNPRGVSPWKGVLPVRHSWSTIPAAYRSELTSG